MRELISQNKVRTVGRVVEWQGVQHPYILIAIPLFRMFSQNSYILLVIVTEVSCDILLQNCFCGTNLPVDDHLRMWYDVGHTVP